MINTYEIKEDCVVGKFQHGKEFIFDKEHFDIIKKYEWIIDSHGNPYIKGLKPKVTAKNFYLEMLDFHILTEILVI